MCYNFQTRAFKSINFLTLVPLFLKVRLVMAQCSNHRTFGIFVFPVVES